MRDWMATMCFAATLSAFAAEPLEFWEMNDSAGTALNALRNAGSRGGVWNHATPDVANGAGCFVVKGDGGAFSRKLPKAGSAGAVADVERYARPVTSGAYRLELNLRSWTLAPESFAAKDGFSFGVNDASGKRFARIAIRPRATAGYDVQFSGFDGAYRTAPLASVGTTPVSFAIEFDFEADAITYWIDDEMIYSGGMTGSEFAAFVYNKNGAWNAPKTELWIDAMGLKTLRAPDENPREGGLERLGLILD